MVDQSKYPQIGARYTVGSRRHIILERLSKILGMSYARCIWYIIDTMTEDTLQEMEQKCQIQKKITKKHA